jgi:hypothetical protein
MGSDCQRGSAGHDHEDEELKQIHCRIESTGIHSLALELEGARKMNENEVSKNWTKMK